MTYTTGTALTASIIKKMWAKLNEPPPAEYYAERQRLSDQVRAQLAAIRAMGSKSGPAVTTDNDKPPGDGP